MLLTAAPPTPTPTPTHPLTGLKDYLNAALITLGCCVFLMTGTVKSKHAMADSSSFGVALMLQLKTESFLMLIFLSNR